MDNTENIDNKPVMVYYCECGKSILRAGDPMHFDRKDWNDYKKAEKEGHKVETITLAEFRKIPFMCGDITDCLRKLRESKTKTKKHATTQNK